MQEDKKIVTHIRGMTIKNSAAKKQD